MLYLRSDEVSRVAGSHQEAVIRTELFSETEVTDPQRLRISRFINVQDVTGLQVSVYYLQKIAVSIRLTHTHFQTKTIQDSGHYTRSVIYLDENNVIVCV